MFDVELVREAMKQGAGFFLALIMFVVYLYEKRAIEKRLEGIIRDRKGDRDHLLELMGEIKAHLERTDAFEEFARQVMAGTEDPTPKRRQIDRLLAEALAKVVHAKGCDE